MKRAMLTGAALLAACLAGCGGAQKCADRSDSKQCCCCCGSACEKACCDGKEAKVCADCKDGQACGHCAAEATL